MIYTDLNNINPYIISCTNVNRENCPPDGFVYEERQVKWFEIELITWGEGFVITNGEKLHANKNTIFYREPGMVVQGYPPYHCYLVVFDMEYSGIKLIQYKDANYLYTENSSINTVNLSIYNSNKSFLPSSFNIQQFMKTEELFKEIYDCYVSDGVENQFYLKVYLMQLLMHIYKEWQNARILENSSRSTRINYPKIMLVKSYIDDNIKKKIKLKELADIASLSPNFLCNTFKKITGETIVDYINNEKLILAKKELVNTDKCIKEISYSLGFENDTYFYTLFKKKAGLSPIEYRKYHRLI